MNATAELAEAIPNAQHLTLPGLDHLGSGNKNTGGKPDMVAKALKRFFLSAEPSLRARQGVSIQSDL